MVLNVHFSFVFFYSKDKEPLKPKNMLKLAHQAKIKLDDLPLLLKFGWHC